MRQTEPLELGLWEALKEATSAPDEADLGKLLDGLDAALLALDTVGQLQVAAEAIAQIAQVFCDRSTLAFEELEATNSNDGPTMPEDAFDRYVRQTMAVDFEPFIEPLASFPRKSPQRQETAAGASVVGELNRAALLQALDKQMSQEPGLTEAEIFNQVLQIAHNEDVSAWVDTIARMKPLSYPVPLLQLQRSVEMPLIEVWLALLLGGYKLEQKGEFYDLHGIWISQG